MLYVRPGPKGPAPLPLLEELSSVHAKLIHTVTIIKWQFIVTETVVSMRAKLTLVTYKTKHVWYCSTKYVTSSSQC